MNNKAYFLSDVHLRVNVDKLEMERRRELFLLLDQIKEEQATLFIVGDWFDFYFEYGSVVTQTYHAVYTKMQELVQAGVTIHYFAGNHDYWLGSFMSDHIGVKVYKQETVVEFAGKSFFLVHGDGLDKSDVKYQRLQTVIRHPLFIWAFKWLIHPNMGHWIAKMISRGSRKKYAHETPEHLLDQIRKNYPLAEEQFAEGVDYMVTGHIHYPKLKTFGDHTFLTIGDFLQYFSFGYFDGVNLSLKQWPVKQLDHSDLP